MGSPSLPRRPPNAFSLSVPSPSRDTRQAVADSDTNDTDLGTTSPQKLANEVREPNAYILVLSLICLECGIGHLACNKLTFKRGGLLQAKSSIPHLRCKILYTNI